MTTRLKWNLPDQGTGGAFTLRGTPLFLVVSPAGSLDQLGHDPGERDGFVISESESGVLQLETRGECHIENGSESIPWASLTYGSTVVATLLDFEWNLSAEGEVAVDDPLVGTVLGGHKIIGRLGNGSMGVVYRAIQINLEREVALKVLSPKAAKKSPLAVACFKREAVAAGRLSHPNLVQVYDVGNDRGLHFFSMELVPAGDLEERMNDVGPLPWPEALGNLLDATEALLFAREHHLVHRDVKPENLMLTIDGRCKLADLGMAATRDMVEQESSGGTPHFMAPECVSGKADHRSDFYSLGCTLYRLLTHQTPYQGDSVRNILLAHRDQGVPRLKEAGVDAPGGVQELLDWLMAKDPEDRPQDAQGILEDIHNLLDGKRSRGLLMGMAVVAVLAVGVSLFFAFKKTPELEQETVYVKMDSGAAQEERERADALALALAYTTAMAMEEGPLRTERLEAFLLEYPESEYLVRAETELDRLAALSENGFQDAETIDPLAAEKRALSSLETRLHMCLDVQQFGLAQESLALATVPLEWLTPLWTRLETATSSAFQEWEGQHALALAAEDWSAAENHRQDFKAAIQGASSTPAEWTQRLNALGLHAANTKTEVLKRDYRDARNTVLASMQAKVVPALSEWRFRDAAAEFQTLTSACNHSGLKQALAARVVVFQEAAVFQEALFSKLAGDALIPIVEPKEGKRAFATAAGPKGLMIVEQVRGERVERLDPWSLYEHPEVLAQLLDSILGAEQSPTGRQNFLAVVSSFALARQLNTWEQTPIPSVADSFAQECRAWAGLLDPSSTVAERALQEEGFALQGLTEFATSLAQDDAYSSLLHAKALEEHFSLLICWSSDGSATWGLQP